MVAIKHLWMPTTINLNRRRRRMWTPLFLNPSIFHFFSWTKELVSKHKNLYSLSNHLKIAIVGKATVGEWLIQKHHQRSRMTHSTKHNLCPCSVTAFIHNTAILAFPVNCSDVLRWETGTTDYPEYRSLLPFPHDPIQELFLNISGMACICENGVREFGVCHFFFLIFFHLFYIFCIQLIPLFIPHHISFFKLSFCLIFQQQDVLR